MVVPSTGSLSPSSSAYSLSSSSSSQDLPISPSSGGGASLKFLCSYGGKILPRHPDGKLRYVGGMTRVLAVDRSIAFTAGAPHPPHTELLVRMEEMCGWRGGISLRCKLPTEDLDALVSITSDEDLANLVEEYDLAGRCKDASSPPKIRAFLHSAPPPQPSPNRAKEAPSSTVAARTQQKNPCRAKIAAPLQHIPVAVPLGFPCMPCHSQIQQHRHHHQHLLGAVRGVHYCAPSDMQASAVLFPRSQRETDMWR